MVNPIRRSYSTQAERDQIIQDFENQGIPYQVVDKPPWRYVIQVNRPVREILADQETRIRELETRSDRNPGG